MNQISLPILASNINPDLYTWEQVYYCHDEVGTYELFRGVIRPQDEMVYVRLWQALKGFPHGTMTSEIHYSNSREWFAHHDKIYGVDTHIVIEPMLFA